MPSSAFFAVIRDVAKLAAAAADDVSAQSAKLIASADDIAVMTGKAAAKTMGVAGDDLAVGAGQVNGIAANREIPAVLRIAKGSAINKLWLSIVLLVVGAYFPMAITIALALGGLYLAYEGGEGLLEKFIPHAASDDTASLSEDQKVRSAIATDLVLSLEILVITLSTVSDKSIEIRTAVLFIMAFIMTVGVYGLILLLIRLDDMGLALVKSPSAGRQWLGQKLIKAAPAIIKVLGPIGMVAMFLVAGGIFTHLVHLQLPHWTLGLAADLAVGVGIGLTLAGIHHIGAKALKR